MSLSSEQTDFVTLEMYKDLEQRISEIEIKLRDLEVPQNNDVLSPMSLLDRCIPSIMIGSDSDSDIKLPTPLIKRSNLDKIPEMKKIRVCKKEPKEAKRLDGTTKTYVSADSANFWSAISLTYDKYKKAVPENRLSWNLFRGVFSKSWHAASAADKELWAKEGTELDWSSLSQ